MCIFTPFHCPSLTFSMQKCTLCEFFSHKHIHMSLTQLLLFTPWATICVKYQLKKKWVLGWRHLFWQMWDWLISLRDSNVFFDAVDFILRSQSVLASALVDVGLSLWSESSWDIEVSEVLFPSLSSATGTDTPSTQKVRAQRKSKFSTGNYNTVIPFMCAHLINTIILTWF